MSVKEREMKWQHSARVGVEFIHSLVWIFLVAGLFCLPKEKSWIPIVILLLIPLSWHVWKECPLTVVENYIYTFPYRTQTSHSTRNRWGTVLRKKCKLSLQQWDSLLQLLTVLLLVLYMCRPLT